jgi:hypothetical protein
VVCETGVRHLTYFAYLDRRGSFSGQAAAFGERSWNRSLPTC